VTRQEAIRNVADAYGTVANDRCVGEAEHLESDRELRDVLRALGVSDAEMPARLLALPPDEEIDRKAAENARYWRERVGV
jgi:hypothetical protein